MATDSLWIRLNIDWDRAKWIRPLPRATRSLWPDLLRWVKMNSPVKGFIGFCDAESLAWDMRLEDGDDVALKALLDAAQVGGAITIEGGRLSVQNWDEYQDPETIRKRRAKEKEAEKSGKDADGGKRGKIRAESTGAEKGGLSAKTETETETSTSPKSPGGTGGADSAFSSFTEFFTEFKSRYPKRTGSPNWPAAEKKLKPIWQREFAAILDGCDGYRASLERTGKLGSEYVKMASTWVNQRGWEDDYGIAPVAPAGGDGSKLSAPVEGVDFELRWDRETDKVAKFIIGTDELFDESTWRAA